MLGGVVEEKGRKNKPKVKLIKEERKEKKEVLKD